MSLMKGILQPRESWAAETCTPAAVQGQRSRSPAHRLEICVQKYQRFAFCKQVGGGGHAAEGKKRTREALRKRELAFEMRRRQQLHVEGLFKASK